MHVFVVGLQRDHPQSAAAAGYKCCIDADLRLLTLPSAGSPQGNNLSHHLTAKQAPQTATTRSLLDTWLVAADTALRTVSGVAHATRPMPKPAATLGIEGQAATSAVDLMSDDERRLSGSLMRVNHVGEVCAQALYQAQGLTARTAEGRAHMAQAAREELDHLAWTQARLRALGDRPSLLNPLWYAGSFAVGLAAGAMGDRISLGFVVETEKQVEAHLASHLDRLPASDLASRAVVANMQADEARHAAEARGAGGSELPAPVKGLMRLAAKVMTTTAHRI